MKKVLVAIRIISAVLAWSLFFFWWKKVLSSTDLSSRTVLYSLLAIGATLLAAILYSVVWIFHNKRVAHRGKRGSVSFYKSPLFEKDAIGRNLKVLPMNRDGYDPVIVVHSTPKTKEFVVEELGSGVAG